jgi:cell division protein ZapE
MGPLEIYRARVVSGALAADPAQEKMVAALQRLYDDLVRAGEPARGWRRGVARLLKQRAAPKRGLYLWGGVGRGKTLMMDLFFGALPFRDKMRRHFHRFMADVHEHLKELGEREDPLELVADRIAADARIICFDELVVTDIADAMILGTLFAALFERGVTLAATSNIEPGHLYRDGLQRQRFLPTIDLLRKHCEVLHVDGAVDYRLRVLERADVYQTPSGPAADAHLGEYFDAIAPDEGDHGGGIEVLGRRIDYVRAADGVIWFDFPAICDGPRSQDDYIELSRLYQTVIVSNVPRFDALLENQARRFIALVDEFYDRRVKLILSAATSVGDLYAGEKLRHDFQRTRSRLIEMQTHDYLASPHQP